MKDNERENDIFDELLRDALASDAAPSDDFTARLMEQVRRTPQEKPLRKQPVVKLLAAVAACAVIAAAIPLAMPRMGSSAADNAAPAASADCADTAAEDNNDCASSEQLMMTEPTADDGENNKQLPRSDGDSEYMEVLTLTGGDARAALAALDAMDIQPTETENDRYTYDLTRQQAQALGEDVDALYGIEGSLTLVLEVTE